MKWESAFEFWKWVGLDIAHQRNLLVIDVERRILDAGLLDQDGHVCWLRPGVDPAHARAAIRLLAVELWA